MKTPWKHLLSTAVLLYSFSLYPPRFLHPRSRLQLTHRLESRIFRSMVKTLSLRTARSRWMARTDSTACQVLNGGVLTHSPFTNLVHSMHIFSVVNESQILTTNIPATLNNTNVDTNSIVVKNASATVTYTPNVDYLVTVSNQFTQLILTTNSAITQGAMRFWRAITWSENFRELQPRHQQRCYHIVAGGATLISPERVMPAETVLAAAQEQAHPRIFRLLSQPAAAAQCRRRWRHGARPSHSAERRMIPPPTQPASAVAVAQDRTNGGSRRRRGAVLFQYLLGEHCNWTDKSSPPVCQMARTYIPEAAREEAISAFRRRHWPGRERFSLKAVPAKGPMAAEEVADASRFISCTNNFRLGR